MDPLFRDLIGALTTIRPGSANETNALAFLRDNTTGHHISYPDVRRSAVRTELAGVCRKLRLWGQADTAARLEEWTSGIGFRADYAHCLLELSGRPLSVHSGAIVARSSAEGPPPTDHFSTAPVSSLDLDDWRAEFDIDGDASSTSGDSHNGSESESIASSGGRPNEPPVASSKVPDGTADNHAGHRVSFDTDPSPPDDHSSSPPGSASVFELLEMRADERWSISGGSQPPHGALTATGTLLVRLAGEDVYVSAVLDALQGNVAAASAAAHDNDCSGAVAALHEAVFVIDPVESDVGFFPADGALSTLAPPFTQLLAALDPMLASPMSAQLHACVQRLAPQRSAYFMPLALTDGGGSPPFACPGVGHASLRSQLQSLLTSANQLRWVDWVCAAVVRSHESPLLLHELLGSPCASTAGDVPLVRFGRTATQLARSIQAIVDDMRLDVACLQAAHRDGAHNAALTAANDADAPSAADVDGLLACLTTGDSNDASAVAHHQLAHPRLTLVVLSAWLRLYRPTLQLLIELVTRCFLQAPPSSLPMECSATTGISSVIDLDSDASMIASALQSLGDAMFPAWSAAQCIDALSDAMQVHATMSSESGFEHPRTNSARAFSSFDRLMPVSDLPEPEPVLHTALRLLLGTLPPYLRALDGFMHGGDTGDSTLSGDLPFSSAGAQVHPLSAITVCLLAHLRQLMPASRVSAEMRDEGDALVPQRLLFEGLDASDCDVAARPNEPAVAGCASQDDIDALEDLRNQCDSALGGMSSRSLTLLSAAGIAPRFMRVAARPSRPDASHDRSLAVESVADIVLQIRACRLLLASVDAAAELGDPVLAVSRGGRDGSRPGQQAPFGSLLFAPLVHCFSSRLAETLALSHGPVPGRPTLENRAADVGPGAASSSGEEDVPDTRLHTRHVGAHLAPDGVESDRPLTAGDLEGDLPTDSEALLVSTCTGSDSVSRLPAPLHPGADVTASLNDFAFESASVITAASSAAVSVLTADAYGASFSVRSSRPASADSIASTRSSASTKPVFQPGYGPLPGTKRSAWWEIDAQVDTNRSDDGPGVGHGGSTSESRGSHDGTAAADSGSTVAPRPPRRPVARYRRGRRAALPAPLGDMSAIIEDSDEDDEDEDDAGGFSELDGSGGDLSSDEGEIDDGVLGSGVGTSRCDSRLIDDEAPIPDGLPVEAAGSSDGAGASVAPAGGVTGAAHSEPFNPKLAREPHAAAPGSISAATPAAARPDPPSDWLLPEHVWAAGAERGLGERVEWDAIAALLYPAPPSVSATTAGGAVAVATASPASGGDALARLVDTAPRPLDLGCETVTSLLRRDLVGCVVAQHSLLSRAVCAALLDRLHLLSRHLWALRAVCLFQQGTAMGEFTAPLFTALASGRGASGALESGHLAVRDSYRLTQWLRAALRSAPTAPAATLSTAAPADGDGRGAASSSASAVRTVTAASSDAVDGGSCWLVPDDFSLVFAGYSAATDDALLTGGLRLRYAPAEVPSPLAAVLDDRVLADYNALFGHVLWVKCVADAVSAAVRGARAAGREIEARLAAFPPDWTPGATLRAGVHAAHLRLRPLLHFAQVLHGHTLHSLLTQPWDDLCAALQRAHSDGGGLGAMRGAHGEYLATLRRLCLMGGGGQRAAAAAQQALLARAHAAATQLAGWFSAAAAGAAAAAQCAARDPAAYVPGGDHATARHRAARTALSESTLHEAATALLLPGALASGSAALATADAFQQQLAFVVKATLGGGAAGQGALRELAAALDHNGFYSLWN